ncbi:uncharacterized protein [Rutidosis leptorrhynchoides]|uniref:uncharacterized protein n=1 Tax=Rutidosis leptorrhynchoides TaxID=125765 RepID=UPI003A99A634
MYRDTKEIIKACVSCQRHAPQIHMPAHELIPVTFAWSFYKWAIDLVGPFPDGKYLVVAIDFFTKWVEAKPLKSITGNRLQMGKSNLLTETLLCGLRQVVISAEIAVPSQRVMEFNDESNVINLKENLDLLEERHDIAAIREASNKQKNAKYYNQRVRERTFRPGDCVWHNNNASRVEDIGKLRPNCEGSYVIAETLGNGAYNLKTHDGKFVPRTWHATNLKKFYI